MLSESTGTEKTVYKCCLRVGLLSNIKAFFNKKKMQFGDLCGGEEMG